jgi:hypothetical protein
MEGRKKGHGKKAAAYVLYKSANIGCTLCAAAMGRQQHSKLSPPNKPANKVQHFLFFSSVCSRIVRNFSLAVHESNVTTNFLIDLAKNIKR